MKKLGYLLAGACVFLAVSGTASGDCSLSNLDGAWRVYSPGESAFGWLKCTVEVDSGQVLANRVCENELGESWLTTGGQLSMNDVCRVSGYIDTQAGRVTLVHSFLEANLNQVWMGVVQLEEDGTHYVFNGIRGLSTGGVQ